MVFRSEGLEHGPVINPKRFPQVGTFFNKKVLENFIFSLLFQRMSYFWLVCGGYGLFHALPT
jgi:putative lipase involved disintegration of autophagic bodies